VDFCLQERHEKAGEETSGEMARLGGQDSTRCCHRTLLLARNKTTEMQMPQLLFTHQQVRIQAVLLGSWLMERQGLSATILITKEGPLRRLVETQPVQVHTVSGEQWGLRPVVKLSSRNRACSFFSSQDRYAILSACRHFQAIYKQFRK